MKDGFDLEQLHQFFSDEDNVRLFKVGVGKYVQYIDSDPFPVEIYEYMMANKGERPPYLQLPEGPYEFNLSLGGAKPEICVWSGIGRVPPEVIAYVEENGTLPGRPSAA